MGFGRSDHLETIERSVLVPHKVKSFHIVAHSLGSTLALALALAVKYADSVETLTLLAPVIGPLGLY